METIGAIAGATQVVQEDKNSKKDEGGDIEPKEFFWDQFITYISTAILALTVLNVSVEFLRGGGVTCFPPSSAKDLAMADKDEMNFEISRGQSEYLNNFCSHSIPKTEYFPIFILAQGFLLVTPHFIWKGLFKGDFDSFFAICGKFDRLRDRNTGEYNPKNFDRVEKLELEFGGKRKQILNLYVIKLLLQACICIGSVILSSLLFVNYSFSFDCPMDFSQQNIPKNWPLNATVSCVYTSLRVLSLVRFADYILIVTAFVLVSFGLVWCAIRHIKELGHEDIASFVFESSLPTTSYVFPRFFMCRRESCTPKCWCCSCRLPCLYLFTPRIQDDLDLLLMHLFRADPSHGRVFKEIQIEKHLRGLRGDDHEILHLFLNIKLDRESKKEKGEDSSQQLPTNEAHSDSAEEFREFDYQDAFRRGGFTKNPDNRPDLQKKLSNLHGRIPMEPVRGIRDRLYGFVQLAFPTHQIDGDKNYQTMAMDISFGSTGYALTLARAFHNVISVNFHQFFRNEEDPVKSEYFYTNNVNVHFPENVFSQKSETINKAFGHMVKRIDRTEKQIDFIVIGPFTDNNKIAKVTLAIEMLYTASSIAKGAILLAVRPLMIGHRNVSKIFCKYQPPKLFDYRYHKKEVLPKMKREIEEKDFVFVGDPQDRSSSGEGIVLCCGGIPCVFEFRTYKFVAEAGKLQPIPPKGLFTEV